MVDFADKARQHLLSLAHRGWTLGCKPREIQPQHCRRWWGLRARPLARGSLVLASLQHVAVFTGWELPNYLTDAHLEHLSPPSSQPLHQPREEYSF